MEDKITLNDVEQYQHFLNKIPAFLLRIMAKRNSSIVKKFESRIKSHIVNLSDSERKKLDVLLNTDMESYKY